MKALFFPDQCGVVMAQFSKYVRSIRKRIQAILSRASDAVYEAMDPEEDTWMDYVENTIAVLVGIGFAIRYILPLLRHH